jgi:hypothetical protein
MNLEVPPGKSLAGWETIKLLMKNSNLCVYLSRSSPFKLSVLTSKKTQPIPITYIKWLTFVKGIIAVYTEIHTKHINTLCKQKAELLIIKEIVYIGLPLDFKRLISYVCMYICKNVWICTRESIKYVNMKDNWFTVYSVSFYQLQRLYRDEWDVETITGCSQERISRNVFCKNRRLKEKTDYLNARIL